ncbi:ABC transporter ATP-binding protein [Deinococcus pimensis]|uniref:ABC transporter ATP-binding protein n=1 Tax=Deinococcus pimensis TaxID=309888 RepID=UPI0004AF32C2|nr:ABC transporter ATP-binding protein [Deinococcus pimensis]
MNATSSSADARADVPPAPTERVAVSLRDVSCAFGAVKAVDGVSLDVREGEFFSLLGPSGSGKTTCLRLIGGFELPSRGRIELFGRDASRLPPYARDVNTVFQDYALFPHMNVRDNVAYALTVRGVGRRERWRRAEEMLDLVKLSGFGDRRPAQLSGGQRQRVSLARALVSAPRVLLLDEPLGALDLKLREEMQSELRGLQRQLGITFVYVTHDQGEALSMSDRVAVFAGGRVVQMGSPRDVYEFPRTAFVARFVGSANVLDGALVGERPGRMFALRPERVRLEAPLTPGAVQGVVEGVLYQGAMTRCEVRVAGVRVSALVPTSAGVPAVGESVGVTWPADALRPLEDAS